MTDAFAKLLENYEAHQQVEEAAKETARLREVAIEQRRQSIISAWLRKTMAILNIPAEVVGDSCMVEGFKFTLQTFGNPLKQNDLISVDQLEETPFTEGSFWLRIENVTLPPIYRERRPDINAVYATPYQSIDIGKGFSRPKTNWDTISLKVAEAIKTMTKEAEEAPALKAKLDVWKAERDAEKAEEQRLREEDVNQRAQEYNRLMAERETHEAELRQQVLNAFNLTLPLEAWDHLIEVLTNEIERRREY